MRPIDLCHLGNDRVICCWEVDGVLIDPGPQSCVETLLTALGDQEPKAILLTHIHFDHAGGTGALLRRWPDVPVYVHEVGAPHLVDPTRLVASATRLYGEAGMRRLWGEVVAVPADNIRSLAGGETVCADFAVQYTPGHASHHVSYLHEPTGCAFVGDVAGVRITPSDYVLVPTPPPDVDVAAWMDSLQAIARWKAQRLALTHFGLVEEVDEHLSVVRASLETQVQRSGNVEREAFMQLMDNEIRASGGEVSDRYMQAAPPEHLWLGLERWWRTKGKDGFKV